MTAAMEQLEARLAVMRADFLAELHERCDGFERSILALERAPGDADTFADLFRDVHSLKGLGGIHGFSIITTICHHLESFLVEAEAHHAFNSAFVDKAFNSVDLIRRVAASEEHNFAGLAAIEGQLDSLRARQETERKQVLIVEGSRIMRRLFEQTLKPLHLSISIEISGFAALQRLLHERFDLVVVGRELPGLNGLALIAALRMTRCPSKEAAAILVTGMEIEVPRHLGFGVVVRRDRDLPDRLRAAAISLISPSA